MKNVIQSVIRQFNRNHSVKAEAVKNKANECNYKNNYYGDQLCKVKLG
ncbi:hypothetical protein [Thalassotalea euphylliae]|nr:hypothetical protein [Thalassotalea euphylliae]